MQEFLRLIQLGLRPEENEILLAGIIIGAFILFFIIFYIVARWIDDLRYTRRGYARFSRLIRTYDLTILEIDYLQYMSRCLSASGKIYQLLLNPLAFRNCLREMKRRQNEINEAIINRIGKKVFDIDGDFAESIEKPREKEQIAPGGTVFILRDEKDAKKRQCRVRSIRKEYLYIEAPEAVFRRREDVRIYLESGTHIYNGEVVRKSVSGKKVLLRLHHIRAMRRAVI